mmetsp:Transcript_18267/g.57579  ORF Transcript_18267/g.57579 Transcript_18267/m.57579 type:complete len:214 (+) Transcript_18267:1102-1743(+)
MRRARPDRSRTEAYRVRGRAGPTRRRAAHQAEARSPWLWSSAEARVRAPLRGHGLKQKASHPRLRIPHQHHRAAAVPLPAHTSHHTRAAALPAGGSCTHQATKLKRAHMVTRRQAHPLEQRRWSAAVLRNHGHDARTRNWQASAGAWRWSTCMTWSPTAHATRSDNRHRSDACAPAPRADNDDVDELRGRTSPSFTRARSDSQTPDSVGPRDE